MLTRKRSGCEVLFFVLIAYLFSGCMGMKTLDTKEVVDGIYSISDLFVNMYLVKTVDQYIAVDAGFRSRHIEKQLKKIDIHPDRVVAVLITHSHFDHIGALSLFKKATIYLSSKEKEFVDQGRAGLGGLKKDTDYQYVLLDDNQTINIHGVKIETILTPGHTWGSVCYLMSDKHLFVGDVLSLHSGSADVLPKIFNEDTKEQTISAARLTNIPRVQNIFTSHYGYTDDVVKAFENWAY